MAQTTIDLAVELVRYPDEVMLAKPSVELQRDNSWALGSHVDKYPLFWALGRLFGGFTLKLPDDSEDGKVDQGVPGPMDTVV